MNTDMETLARVWRKIDDARGVLKAEFEAKDRELETQQDEVSRILNDAMAAMNAKKIDTAAGVIERKQQYKPSAADWGAIYRFVVENDAFEMLHKRLSSTFIQTWAEEHAGDLPPGVNVYTEFKVGVKKPAGKALPKGED